MNRKKQFIAGAICPECSEMDSLVLYTDDQSIVCVSCGFKKTSEQRDSQSLKKTHAAKESTLFKNASMIDITNLDN